ncbi:MAG TPA: vanadium-dependent haloperoxidase [Anaerolineales bacterium]|nr:vanadium-dependent haloperoxidase [Anaerolineales bacterium]
MKVRTRSTKYIVSLFLAAVVMTAIGPALPAQAASANSESVITWNAITIRTVITLGSKPAPAAFVYGAYAQAAVYNAVVAIEGGYQPYKSALPASPGASVDAAVATAAHDVLLYYFPSQDNALNNDYTADLASIPDGKAKTAGIAVGAAAADELIALRQGDGLNVDIGFSMPSPAPGVWELPADINPMVPWLSQLKPFMLKSPDQFRPGPPPKLNSWTWVKQFNEIQLYGDRYSEVRSPEQTEIARFWSSDAFIQYNLTYQQIATERGLSALQTARLMAMGNMVASDAFIGCFDAKYHYLYWRPAYAIPQGNTDGNARTTADPDFAPLLGTPPHPEYPSAHNCLTASQAEVFTKFLGTRRIKVTIPSTVIGVPERHYATAHDLTKEIINARVWAGIHYRSSSMAGANLGIKVAQWTLKQYFQPEKH